MSQRVAGERARWLAAVLIVAAIAASSTIVRWWPVEKPAPPLASRSIQLYQSPTTPQPVPVVSLQAERVRPARHYVAPAARPDRGDVVPPTAAEQAAGEPLPEMVAADLPPAIGVPEAPAPPPEPVATAAVPIADDAPTAVFNESAPAVASSSHGIVEVPAVAVTRAVTIAGRGIMTGLKATGAILRAPF